MKLFFALLFSFYTLVASNIISHNIYERSDRVDIMLLFDSPFNAKITKKEDLSTTILILHDTNINKKIAETINSQIVQNLNIIPHKNQIYVEIDSKNPFEITTSKTVDNFGLRLRIKPKNILTENTLSQKLEPTTYRTKQDSQDISNAFLKVVLILILLVAVLYFLKNWILNRTNGEKSWLFKNTADTKEKKIKVLNQKALDTKNRVAVIEFNNYKYLVILGNNNILLDKFKSEQISEDDNFEDILKDNTQKLDEFIKSKTDKLKEIF